MKTVFLHGLGQTAQDWKEVAQQLSISDVDCPGLFSSTEDEISYSQILGDLEQRYSEVKEPLRICGLSLGALLAIDFAIRHEEKVDSLVLIGAQYKVPSLLIDFQNLIFRCMPNKAANPRAVYACLNLGQAAAPREIQRQSICIDGDIGAVLAALKD